ncbi:hypothetical protein IUY40_10705 [Flavobacterium sp. ALJ2]|uniref:hypothetical protein n=1 Tax=Flavobacterium sp. ALJ2 TaxID=2786960 RepID=UPI00189CC416|nr:hypothetical protein [Flavobacterium sp. ALJ2]MBF7092008.1 hypothetical protein [Flavobacterium sp. ALJ2]
MAKGVKKIKWTGVGKVISGFSRPNEKLAIAPDQEVSVEVSEWYEGTPEADKRKNITWILQDRKARKIIKQRTLPANSPKKISIPKVLCGPFEYYIEASLYGSVDLRNETGLYVRGYCTPKIVSSKWCKTNNGTDVRKQYFFGYGEIIYLNLVTEGLNGNLNLGIDIYRRIRGEDQFIKRYSSVDVIDGQINYEINDSFSWYNAVKKRKELEEFYVKVFDPADRLYITDNTNDTAHARFLRVKDKIASITIKPSKSLSLLKIGEPDKNFVSYHYCKYTFIKMNDKLFFDEAKLIKGQNVGKEIVIHLFAGGNDKYKKIKIELGEKRPGKCDNHRGQVFDITDLQKAGFTKAEKISNNAFSFDNTFKYKHQDDYKAFFLEYFLPGPVVKASLPLASCGYQHILDININPDVAWAYHFQYDKPNGGFFKDINIKIQTGLDEELEYLTPYLDASIKLLFNELPESMRELMVIFLTDYFKNSASSFGFGIHAYHTFDESQNKPAVIMDYTAKYPWIARTLITTLLVVSVIIDIITLYITRGRGAVATKAGKVAENVHKYGRSAAITMERKGFETITPKITSFRAQYFEKQADGRIAFVQTEKVSALPLFGLQYEDKHTLGSITTSLTGISTVFDYARKAMSIFGRITLLKKISDKLNKVPTDPNKLPGVVNKNDVKSGINYVQEAIENSIDGLAEKLGHKLEFILTIKGEYHANYQVFINHLVGAVSIEDQLENYVNNSKGIIGRKKGIDAVASCQLKTGFTIKTDWIMRYAPDFIKGVVPVIDKEAKVEGQAEIHGSLFFERKYTYKKPKSYYVDNVIFSGIAGTLSGSVKMKDNGKTPKTKKSEITETQFILMEPYVVKGEKVFMFDDDIINKPK